MNKIVRSFACASVSVGERGWNIPFLRPFGMGRDWPNINNNIKKGVLFHSY